MAIFVKPTVRNTKMNSGARIIIFAIGMFFYSFVQAQEFNRTAFYAALSTGDTSKINDQIAKISKLKTPHKEACTGVLMMRKAEMAKGLRTKLDLFKAGGTKLESAISKDKSNAEYRFFRLLIQENAPSILNYNNNISEDAKIITTNYSSMPAETQHAVMDYIKKSKVLKVTDF